MYALQVASTVYFNTEKLLSDHFAHPILIGWYEIANDLATKIRNALASLDLRVLQRSVSTPEAVFTSRLFPLRRERTDCIRTAEVAVSIWPWRCSSGESLTPTSTSKVR